MTASSRATTYEDTDIVIEVKATAQKKEKMEDLLEIYKQLWGEAMHCFKSDDRLELTEKLKQHLQNLRATSNPSKAYESFLREHFLKGNLAIKVSDWMEQFPHRSLSQIAPRWGLVRVTFNEWEDGKRRKKVYFVKKDYTAQFLKEQKQKRKCIKHS